MSEWTIIINKNWQQHLTYKYDAKEDVVRVNVKLNKNTFHKSKLKLLTVDGNVQACLSCKLFGHLNQIFMKSVQECIEACAACVTECEKCATECLEMGQ